MNDKNLGSQDSHIDNNARVRGFFRLRPMGNDRQRRMEEAYAANPIAAIASSDQFRAMVAAAAAFGLTLVPQDVTPEFGTSAASPVKDRPVLGALIEAAERGEYDVLVVSRPVDLWRSVAVCEEIVERLERTGIRLIWPGCEGHSIATFNAMVTHLGAVRPPSRSDTAKRVWKARKEEKN